MGEVLSEELLNRPLPSALHGRVVLARGMRLAEELHERGDDLTEEVDLLTDVRCLVQELIDVSEKAEEQLFAVSGKKPQGPYLGRHVMNVTTLAVLLGKRLALNRKDLMDLGLCGMYHELGRTSLPDELLNEKGAFDEEQKAAYRVHPLRGTRRVLDIERQSRSFCRRALCAFELNIPVNGAPVRKWADVHPFAKILGVVCVYDALTTERTWRAAETPDQAIIHLLEGVGERFDARIVSLLAGMVGA